MTACCNLGVEADDPAVAQELLDYCYLIQLLIDLHTIESPRCRLKLCPADLAGEEDVIGGV